MADVPECEEEEEVEYDGDEHDGYAEEEIFEGTCLICFSSSVCSLDLVWCAALEAHRNHHLAKRECYRLASSPEWETSRG